jgi:hypothetical protein
VRSPRTKNRGGGGETAAPELGRSDGHGGGSRVREGGKMERGQQGERRRGPHSPL